MIKHVHDRSSPGGGLSPRDARREVALSYVKTITHDNWEKLRQDDPAAIRAYHDELRELAADRERMRRHLLNTSMINSLRGGKVVDMVGVQPR